MSTHSVGNITSQGFEPPRNVQFSVFLDNRVGKLLELVGIFQGHALRVAGFTVLDSADYAVVRLVTSRSDLARRLLTRHNMPFGEAEILIVEMDTANNFSSLCSALLQAEINIHFAYPLLIRPRGKPAIALHTDDHHLACQLLRRRLFHLLAENDLGDNALHDDLPEDPPGL